MEFFKEWTVGIASAVIFASLCEIMLPSGNMKKYVNLILGIILSISMLKPLADAKFNDWSDRLFDFERTKAFEIQTTFDEDEKSAVIKIYTGKIENAVKKELSEKINADFTVEAGIETEKEGSFGEIKSLLITVVQKEGFKDYREEIENIIKSEFGVSEKNIRIKFKNS